MAITETTTFSAIVLSYDPIFKFLQDINYRPSGGSETVIYFTDGNPPDSGDEAVALEVLKSIYSTHGGFPRNSDGDLLDVVFSPNHLGFDDLSAPGEDWPNPFLDPDEAAATLAAEDDAKTRTLFGDDDEFSLSGNAFSVQFTASSTINTITWEAVPKNKIISVDFDVRIHNRISVPVHITRAQIAKMGYVTNSDWPWSSGDAQGTAIGCVLILGDRYSSSVREVLFDPTHFHVDSLRQADTPMVIVFFRESSDGSGLIGMYVRMLTGTTTYKLEAGTVTYEAD